MVWLSQLGRRLLMLFRHGQFHADLEEEMRLHRELRAQEKIAEGISPEEAHYAVSRQFGNDLALRERSRDMWGWNWLETFFQDLRYGLRQLRRNPGFTIVAVITLALGIGANTAMFSVIYGVLLRPLPYPQADRIVQISRTFRGQVGYSGFTANAFDFWQAQSRPFQYVAASTPVGFDLAGAGRAERVNALRVSIEYFHVFGTEPILGRDFNSAEEQTGGPNVAILSHRLWEERFSSQPDVIGRTILLNGAPFEIVGVMPSGFARTFSSQGPNGALLIQMWTTIGQVRDSIGGGQNYEVDARLKSGVTLRQADAYLAALAHTFIVQNYPYVSPDRRSLLGFVAAPYRYIMTKDARTPLIVLFGAIGFVLLIACANVANLLLARTATRNREIALRTALGAGRGRILRQLLTESFLLAGLGAALGLFVAFGGLRFLLALAPDILPRAHHVAINGWALLFTAGVAALTGILFGLAPALQASHTNLNESLKEGEGRASFGFHRQRLTPLMVSSEVALSLILLVGSGLLIRTFTNLMRVDPGFDPHHLLALPFWTAGSKYNSMPKLSNFYQQMTRRIGAVAGAKSAAVVAGGSPLRVGLNLNPGVRVNGTIRHPSVDYREVSPNFFEALGVPVLKGRAFAETDSSGAAKVAIINRAFAARFYLSQDPIGRHLLMDHSAIEIVGVVGDVRSELREPTPPTFFVPIAQADFSLDQGIQGWFPAFILVRSSVKPLSLSHAVSDAVRNSDPTIPIGHVQSMEQMLSFSLAFQRFLMTLMTVFAALALGLAAVGVYGVLSYSVRQRTHEIGIRMALGAERRDVLSLIVRQGLWLALIGIAAGLAASFPLASLIRSQLYGVQPTDLLTFFATSLVVMAIALLAAYIPARRAAKVDPMVALRYE